MNWARIVLDTDQWQALMNMVMNLRVIRICNERPCMSRKTPLIPRKDICSVALVT
jgi:hypothetical protein